MRLMRGLMEGYRRKRLRSCEHFISCTSGNPRPALCHHASLVMSCDEEFLGPDKSAQLWRSPDQSH